jgi:hypothetical protein
MIARVCLYFGLAVLATLACFTQLDRQAFVMPPFAQYVPQPFRAAGQQRLVEMALATNNPAAALAGARDLIRKRPMPARHLVLFAGAAQLAGQDDRVIAPLEVAAVRGWREPVVQLAVARAGILSGDFRSAAQRVVALVATAAPRDQTDALLTVLLADADGRAALADMLATQGHWNRRFIARLQQAGTPAQLVDTLDKARARGAMIDCAELQTARDSLIRDGHADLAPRIQQDGC